MQGVLNDMIPRNPYLILPVPVNDVEREVELNSQPHTGSMSKLKHGRMG